MFAFAPGVGHGVQLVPQGRFVRPAGAEFWHVGLSHGAWPEVLLARDAA